MHTIWILNQDSVLDAMNNVYLVHPLQIIVLYAEMGHSINMRGLTAHWNAQQECMVILKLRHAFLIQLLIGLHP